MKNAAKTYKLSSSEPSKVRADAASGHPDRVSSSMLVKQDADDGGSSNPRQLGHLRRRDGSQVRFEGLEYYWSTLGVGEDKITIMIKLFNF
jgi:hypothetical protein